MFESASDLFVAFLDGIRKTHTVTVKPIKFTRIWNEWAMPEWIASNTSMKEGVELSQKQIDDLANIRKVYHMYPASWSAFAFKKPDTDSALYSEVYDELSNATVTDPVTYLRALSVQFKLNYSTSSAQECGLTGESGWLNSTYLKSGMENVVKKSFYRKPKDSRLYHKIVGNYIQVVNDPTIGSSPTRMRLDFLYYPNTMSYDETYGFQYDIDLPFYQLTEIVQIAVRLYLERTQSPRWQSFFQEDIAKRVDKI